MDLASRIRLKSLLAKVCTPATAAALVKDGMTVGVSGFSRNGDIKVLPAALAERAETQALRITLMSGASVGDGDRLLSRAKVIGRRMPYMSDSCLRRQINTGEVLYTEQHLSEVAEHLRGGHLPKIDLAVIEVTAITEEGGLVPTTSVGNSANYAQAAETVIVEVNLGQPAELEGMHDVYIPDDRPARRPIPIVAPDDRIGTPFIPLDPARIAAIVISDRPDDPVPLDRPDEDSRAMAGHLIEFFSHEVKAGRLTHRLAPLQSGIGSVANALLLGFVDSPFHDLSMYTEVLQDSVLDMIDAGKLVVASTTALSLSAEGQARLRAKLPHYKPYILFRPQEISNHPEVIRRLGLIALNTALEADIYGNVNSTHVNASQVMNGIGGSGDFSGNAQLACFSTHSLAKQGAVSSIVPMVTHVDHREHDVDVLVTEQGLADLRGKAPRERARLIIENCMHPSYRDMARDYFREALRRGGHTPHVLEQAFAWHLAFQKTGSMLPGLEP
jgi:succinyl-CoA:acetate CoA-transferase